jgi:hypothetical protein
MDQLPFDKAHFSIALSELMEGEIDVPKMKEALILAEGDKRKALMLYTSLRIHELETGPKRYLS